MKTVIVLFAAFALVGLAGAQDAQDNLRQLGKKKRKKNKDKGSKAANENGQKNLCKNKGNEPDDLKALIKSFMAPDPSPLDPAVACTEDHITKVLEWSTTNPTGPCGSKFSFETELDSCCGGYVSDNSRSITVDAQFASPREISGVSFDINLIYEKKDCCKTCKCWGDPHCSSFDSTTTFGAARDIKSFLACDTAFIQKNGKCTNRLDDDEGARKRCLGEDPDYDYNGPDENGAARCRWRPTTPGDDYNVAKDGGPCVPANDEGVSMHMFGHSFGQTTEVSSAGGGNTPLKGRYDVFAVVGERGVMEGVNIRVEKKGQSGSNSLSGIKLLAKKDCAYLQNMDGDSMVPNEGQSATLAILDDEMFHITRTLSIQSAPDGTNNALDLFWNVADKINGDSFHFNCRGATDQTARGDNYASFQQLLNDKVNADESSSAGVSAFSGLTDLYQSTGQSVTVASGVSVSTRTPKQTIIDSKFFVPTVPKDTGGEAGFCYTGEFEEYKAVNWFDGENSPFEAVCGTGKNLDFADRNIIASFPDCQALLKINQCDDFPENDIMDMHFKGSDDLKKSFNEYSEILDKCIITYCQKAFVPDAYSVEECVTDFYDYGATITMDVYSENAKDLSPVDSTAPVWQADCVNKVNVHYETKQGYTGDKEWTEGDGPISFLVSGTPSIIILEQNDCAGICGTRPKVEFDATFTTDCEELPEDYQCHKKGSNDACDSCLEECADECQ